MFFQQHQLEHLVRIRNSKRAGTNGILAIINPIRTSTIQLFSASTHKNLHVRFEKAKDID